MSAYQPRAVACNPSPLRWHQLRPDVVYVSPRGLLCRLVPARTRGPGCSGEQFEFAYIGRSAKRSADGFWLSAGNVSILRAGATVERDGMQECHL